MGTQKSRVIGAKTKQGGVSEKKWQGFLESCIEQALMLEFNYTGSLEVRAWPAKRIRVREDLPRILGPSPTKAAFWTPYSPLHNVSFIQYGSKK